MRSLPPSSAAVLLVIAVAACSPPAPADPAVVDQWAAVTESMLSGSEPRLRARVSALGALAMYEGFAAEGTVGRSLAGQVNGLWSVPASAKGSVDGAVAAAEGQRLLLATLLPRDTAGLRRVDSLATAQMASRRSAGVSEEIATRSRALGAAIARTLAALAEGDALRTLVLRHPQECAYRAMSARSMEVTPQGATAALAAIAPVVAAVESRVVDALVAADSVTAVRRPGSDDAACVRALVRGRLRTRAAGR